MSYTPKAQEYIDSVDGAAHQSAVQIIGKLEAKNKALKESDELRASLLIKFQDENKDLKESRDEFWKQFHKLEALIEPFKTENKVLEELFIMSKEMFINLKCVPDPRWERAIKKTEALKGESK